MTALSIRYDDDPLFEMTTDYPFDMTRLSLRNEGFLTLPLTIKKTIIFLSFRSDNMNTLHPNFKRKNTLKKSVHFLQKKEHFKTKNRAKNSRNFIISKRQPVL